jgi:hypothetical protein
VRQQYEQQVAAVEERLRQRDLQRESLDMQVQSLEANLAEKERLLAAKVDGSASEVASLRAELEAARAEVERAKKVSRAAGLPAASGAAACSAARCHGAVSAQQGCKQHDGVCCAVALRHGDGPAASHELAAAGRCLSQLLPEPSSPAAQQLRCSCCCPHCASGGGHRDQEGDPRAGGGQEAHGQGAEGAARCGGGGSRGARQVRGERHLAARGCCLQGRCCSCSQQCALLWLAASSGRQGAPRVCYQRRGLCAGVCGPCLPQPACRALPQPPQQQQQAAGSSRHMPLIPLPPPPHHRLMPCLPLHSSRPSTRRRAWSWRPASRRWAAPSGTRSASRRSCALPRARAGPAAGQGRGGAAGEGGGQRLAGWRWWLPVQACCGELRRAAGAHEAVLLAVCWWM